MCGRYGLAVSLEEIAERFMAEQGEFEWRASYNVAPSQQQPVVTQDRKLELMSWGYEPRWMKERGGRPLINAKAETLFSSSTFKRAAIADRVLVPAGFYFEWAGTGAGKTPYLFRLRGEELFGLAGLRFEQNGENRYVIVTTAPNEVARRVHNRMPAILRREDEARWLSPDETEEDVLSRMLLPVPADSMEAYPVSRRVNSPANNSPELLEPA